MMNGHFMNSSDKTLLAGIYNLSPAANGVLVYILDHCLAWFTPRWRKKARAVLKATRRYINYNCDVAAPERIAELQDAHDQLYLALRTGNKTQAEGISNRLESTLEGIPMAIPGGVTENVEVLFVILAIFLGLRAYVVQPFRIPTGSMQPSLNGIRAIPQSGEEPSLTRKIGDMVLYGSSYLSEKADRDKKIVRFVPATKWLLFTVTKVHFDDGSVLEIPAAPAETQRYFQNRTPRLKEEAGTPFRTFHAGDEIVNARFDAGDLIVVNKMAYHFRLPERGEVFVFNTQGIEGISSKSSTGQEGGQHYVKRLCGLPGDSLAIENSQLIVNGAPAKEWTIQRVAAGQPPYHSCGYVALPAPATILSEKHYITEGSTVYLSNSKKFPALREYVALGDNTPRLNSFDSRYWGPVRQFNIVGPACLCLWPFTSHWGLIP